MKRVVIKVGTSTLTHRGGRINIRRLEHGVKVISDLANAGCELLLVSSGAIGVGISKLGLSERPSDLPTKQACAAVGQSELMYLYDHLFGRFNRTVAQILLTREEFELPTRRDHMHNTLSRLLELGILPIINENDTVAVDEILVGDNDTLSALVAVLVEADTLLMLTDIDGFYDKDPHRYEDARLLEEVSLSAAGIDDAASGAGSERGTGGMLTKLGAARIAVAAGIDTRIISGQDPDNLYRLYDGETVGTRFVP